MNALFQEIHIHLAQLHGWLAGLNHDDTNYTMWLGVINLQEHIVRAMHSLYVEIHKSSTPAIAMVHENTSQAVDSDRSNQEVGVDLDDSTVQQEDNIAVISRIARQMQENKANLLGINKEMAVNSLPLKKRKRSSTIIADEEEHDQLDVKTKKVKFRRHTMFQSNASSSQQNVSIARVNTKNSDKNVYSLNSLYKTLCILCETAYKGSLVYHYAKAHNEVYISRPSPEYSDKLRKSEIPFGNTPNRKISGICCFCEQKKIFDKACWRRHLLTHTGETSFFCQSCNTSVAVRRDHSDCDSKYVKSIYELETDNDSRLVVGYICSICNYLQIQKQNIVKHLLNEHNSEDGLCEKVVLVRSNTPAQVQETISTPNTNKHSPLCSCFQYNQIKYKGVVCYRHHDPDHRMNQANWPKKLSGRTEDIILKPHKYVQR